MLVVLLIGESIMESFLSSRWISVWLVIDDCVVYYLCLFVLPTFYIWLIMNTHVVWHPLVSSRTIYFNHITESRITIKLTIDVFVYILCASCSESH